MAKGVHVIQIEQRGGCWQVPRKNSLVLIEQDGRFIKRKGILSLGMPYEKPVLSPQSKYIILVCIRKFYVYMYTFR